MKGIKRVLLILALALAAQPCALAQAAKAPPASPPPHRPRIGLALSGGGVRGAAHVGVLRVLEQMRVPVDCIAGTSMGAIVGGLYASGMSPDDIERWLLTTDWDSMITDKPPRETLSFRRKEEGFISLPDVELGIEKGRVVPPRGLIPGQMLENALRTMTLPVSAIRDFDDLPIPFRAVATDIVTGEKVVLKSGDLALSMRASASLPGIIAPVAMEGRLLVDGGLVDNLPVDVVKAMGADVVIAVDITEPPRTREQLNSFVDVTDQVMSLMTAKNIPAMVAAATVVLSPDVSDVRMMEYREAARCIAQGEAAARQAEAKLSAYSVDAEAFASCLARARARPDSPVVPAFVHFESASDKETRLAMERIETRPGKPLDVPTLEKDLTSLYDLGIYDRVSFDVRSQGGRQGVVFFGERRPGGPYSLRLGLYLQDDFAGLNSFNLRAIVKRTSINSLGAEWRNLFQVGHTRMAYTEFYQPLEVTSTLFVAPALSYESTLRAYYDDDGVRIADYNVRSPWVGVDLGSRLGNAGEIRVGIRRGRLSGRVNTGPPTLPKLSDDWGGFEARLVLDTLDSPNFAKKGNYTEVRGFLSSDALGADLRYKKASLSTISYLTRGEHTVWSQFSMGTSFGTQTPVYDQFFMGGFLNFTGYHPDQLRGRYMGFLGLGWYREIGHMSPAFGRGFFLGVWTEMGNTWLQSRDISFSSLRYSLATGVGADTRIGPLYLAYGRTKDGHDAVYLSLGRSF